MNRNIWKRCNGRQKDKTGNRGREKIYQAVKHLEGDKKTRQDYLNRCYIQVQQAVYQ